MLIRPKKVFLDVSDIVNYNVELLNRNDLRNSFFCLSREDPTVGFTFDAANVAGHVYSVSPEPRLGSDGSEFDALRLRLHVGSHLAQYLRLKLEEEKGYTSTVGISTSKLLSKLVGNLNKPKGQTTLMPPYESEGTKRSSVIAFMDDHEIGRIPGIGFKSAQKIRDYISSSSIVNCPGDTEPSGVRHKINVKEVREFPGMCPELLENILQGPGAPRGIGSRIWAWLHGSDDSTVGQATEIPKQISIEDSYRKLDTLNEVLEELTTLAKSLLNRMRWDLLEENDEPEPDQHQHYPSHTSTNPAVRRWIAFPKTLRLSTRPRAFLDSDNPRARSVNRTSRSIPLPNFVFNLSDHVDALAEKLVTDALLPLFRRLHPERTGWDLSLINIAVTNMVDAGGDGRNATGRDISKMFKGQTEALRERDAPTPTELKRHLTPPRKRDQPTEEPVEWEEAPRHESGFEGDWGDASSGDAWDSDGAAELTDESNLWKCEICGMSTPEFAASAHGLFHAMAMEAEQ